MLRASIADSSESARLPAAYEIEHYNGNPDAGWWFEKTLRTHAG